MILDPNTIQQFIAYQSQIVAADPLVQVSTVHKLEVWRQTFASSPLALNALDDCVSHLKTKGKLIAGQLHIDRKVIFDAITDELDVRARFLMQMLWGHNPRDGRAKGKVLKWLISPGCIDQQTLPGVISEIVSGELKTAFGALCSVKDMNTSYATKVIYFESRLHRSDYGLILDEVVSNSLVKLTSPLAHRCINVSAPRLFVSSEASKKITRKRLSETWDKYWSYVQASHELARHFKTNADHVEYFLYGF